MSNHRYCNQGLPSWNVVPPCETVWSSFTEDKKTHGESGSTLTTFLVEPSPTLIFQLHAASWVSPGKQGEESSMESWELIDQASMFYSSLLHSNIYNQIRSVAQSCPTLWDPMNHSTPGLPVHHQLLEFTQIHVHQVSDAIQPSHPLLSPSPPAPSPSQHQGLSQWVMRWPKDWSLELKVLVGRSSVDLLQSQLSSYPQKHSLVLKKNNINFR